MNELRKGLPNDFFRGKPDERLDSRVEVGNHAIDVNSVDDIADLFHQVAILLL